MAALLILKGPNQGQFLPLTHGVLVLGRSADCDIPIASIAVSRLHARLVNIQDKWYIEDLSSRNGTFVNSQRVHNGRVALKENDRVKIADFLATFVERVTDNSARPTVLQKEDDVEVSSTVMSSLDPGEASLSSEHPVDHLRAIVEVGNDLRKSLELDLLLPKIGDSLFRVFPQADRSLVIFRDEETGRLLPRLTGSRRNHEEGVVRFSKTIVRQCWDTGRAFLSSDVLSDKRMAGSSSVHQAGLRSVMCVPLRSAEGNILAVMQVESQDRRTAFTEEDLKLMEGLAHPLSIALENAQHYEDLVTSEQKELGLEVAGQVQRSILPETLPQVPGYEFFTHYAAALTVGGDYYDFIPLSSRRLAITLGDVAGKGMGAALLMAKLSADARYSLLTEPNLPTAMGRLNDLVCQYAGKTDKFATLVSAVVDFDKHMVTLVNVGHVSPLLYRRAEHKLLEGNAKSLAGLPLGLLKGQTYLSWQVALHPGDCFILFSDGVSDAFNIHDKRFEVTGIHSCLQGAKSFTPRTIGKRIIEAVEHHSLGRSQHDDITLVCFGRVG